MEMNMNTQTLAMLVAACVLGGNILCDGRGGFPTAWAAAFERLDSAPMTVRLRGTAQARSTLL